MQTFQCLLLQRFFILLGFVLFCLFQTVVYLRTLTENNTGEVTKDVKLVMTGSLYEVHAGDPERGGYRFEFQFPMNDYKASKGESGVVYLSNGSVSYTLELLFTRDESKFRFQD